MSALTPPEVYFAGEPKSAGSVTAPTNDAERACAAARETRDPQVLEAFIANDDLARSRLTVLRKQTVAMFG
jgi:hypothetical protein